MTSGIPTALEEEPSALLGFVDPVLQQTCGGDITGLVTEGLLAIRHQHVACPEAVKMPSKPKVKGAHVEAHGDIRSQALLQLVNQAQRVNGTATALHGIARTRARGAGR